MPTTSRVSHGRDASSGPVAIRCSRSVSLPYASKISSGETAFLRLLPILPHSRVDGLAVERERRRRARRSTDLASTYIPRSSV